MDEIVQGPEIGTPGADVKQQVPATPLSDKVTDDAFQPENVDDVTYKTMLTDTVNNYIGKTLDHMQLPKTQENLDKVCINLFKQIDKWLTEGEFLLGDIDKQSASEYFLTEACQRRNLPNNTASWKKILKELKIYE